MSKRPKETKFEKICLPSIIVNAIEVPDVSLREILSSFIKASSISHQTASLREIQKYLKEKNDHIDAVCIILVATYYYAKIKNPIRHAIASCVQNFDSNQKETVLHYFNSQLVDLLTRLKFDDDDGFISRRHCIDIIGNLLENFHLGEICVKQLWKEILAFLSSSLRHFMNEVLSCDNAVTLNGKMHDSHVTTQVLNKVLQKSSESIISQEATDILIQLRDQVVQPLLKDNLLLDWRSASAMSVILILKLQTGSSITSQLINEFWTEYSQDNISFENKILGLSVKSLPPSSEVCILNAILAMLGPDMLTTDFEHKILLVDILAPELLKAVERQQDSNSKLMASRTLLLFTHKTRECLSSASVRNTLQEKLHGNASIPQALIQYSCNHWDDTVDAIRHQARLIFENIIQCHLLSQKNDASSDVYLLEMISKLLMMSWQSQSKYGLLIAMVKLLGAAYFLTKEPDLASRLLNEIGDQTLANHVSELYEALSHQHMLEITLQANSERDTECSGVLVENWKNEWENTWISPVLDILCKGSQNQRKHVIEYVVPKILKQQPSCIQYITTELSKYNTGADGHRLGALITCIKRSRMMGGLTRCKDSSVIDNNCQMWNGLLPISVLKQALCHRSDQVRLDAFGLLCENNKTTEVITSQDLELILMFLSYNMESQAPSFRQILVACIKKLMIRLRDGGQAVFRSYQQALKQDKHAPFEIILDLYKKFLSSMVVILFDQLHPRASFPRRTTSLSMLTMMLHILGTSNQQSDAMIFNLSQEMTKERVQTLLECLIDTFEHNKADAYTILSGLPSCHKHLKDTCGDLLDAGLTLATSTRPQDCTSAAYLLRLLVQIPDIHCVLLDKLQYYREKSQHQRKCELMIVDSQFHELLQTENSHSGRILLLLGSLVSEVVLELKMAQRNLLHCAATKPIYPALHVIRYIVTDVNLTSVSSCDMWRYLFGVLITVCFKVAEVVSPVVNNSSPEGNVPEEAMTCDVEEPHFEEESEAKVRLMPEYLVVCCWRSIKEVSLLLGQITSNAPIINPHNKAAEGLLSIRQIEEIGEYFTHQLLDSRHRGAFELAYAGFVKMADMLWRHPLNEVQRLPLSWLQSIMADIRSCDPNSRLCATRRSAGAPFFMQALLSTEPVVAGRVHMKRVVEELLHLSLSSQIESTSENTAQVHSLNILRALFRDTRLGEDVFPYIASAMQASILGYGSKFWAIRNSSSLLFSALMTRIFGVQRDKDDISRKNCLTGRVFFNRFPSLFDFLLSQLKLATEKISDGFHLHPGLYPVLIVLGRLFPSVIDGPDASFNLTAFIPYVIQCSSSAVHKTRVMAARAIRPLVAKHNIITVLRELVEMLPTEAGQSFSQNLLHGLILQISSLLDELADLPVPIVTELCEIIIPKIEAASWLASRNNPCFSTRQECLKLLHRILQYNWPEKDEVQSLIQKIDNSLNTIINEELHVNDHFTHPAAPEFYQIFTMTRLSYEINKLPEYSHKIAQQKIELCFLSLMTSSFYEVRLEVLNFMCTHTRGNVSNDRFSQIENKTFDAEKVLNNNLWMVIERSKQIFDELIIMVNGKEKHHECLTKVLILLSKLPYSSHFPWNISYVNLLIDKVDHSFLDVQYAAVAALTNVIEPLYFSVEQELSAKSALSAIINLIGDRSLTECTVDTRLHIATLLEQNAKLLLQDKSQLFDETEARILYSSLMRLMQDEDSSVREIAAEIPHHLKPWPIQFTDLEASSRDLHSAVATEIMLSVLPMNCKQHVLISWLKDDLEEEWECENEDVRLFDKGEMNTYRDQLHFVSLVERHLSTDIGMYSKSDGNTFEQAFDEPNHEGKEPPIINSTSQNEIDETLSNNIVKFKSMMKFSSKNDDTHPLPQSSNHNLGMDIQKKYIFDELLQHIVAETNTSTEIITPKHPFLNQPSYQEDVVLVCRQLAIINVCIHSNINIDKTLLKKCEHILEKLREIYVVKNVCVSASLQLSQL